MAFLLPLVLVSQLTAAAPNPDAGTPTGDPVVATRMRQAFASLMTLQPYVASPARFSDPKNARIIGPLMEALASTPHAFPKSAAQEPGLGVLVTLFDDYMAGAVRDFRAGRHGMARGKLASVTSLCFACHTRLHAEQDFVDASKQVEGLGLPPLERAQFYAATRQVEPALALYGELLAAKPEGEAGYYRFRTALRSALALLVRVRGDVKATLALLEPLAARSDLPPFLQTEVRALLADARAWQKDRFQPARATPEHLVQKAKTLSRAVGADTFNPEARDLPLLRASNYLHEALTRAPKTPLRAEALYVLAQSANAAQTAMSWPLDTLYLEACVRENPGTPQARKCFAAYEGLVVQGYTGSAGIELPEEELVRLGELRALAD